MDVQRISGLPIHLVDPGDIDDLPGPYCMSFGFDLKPLIRSIETVDLVNCPMVTENSRGTLTIIAGYRRIQALRSLRWGKIPCRILSRAKLSPIECLLMSLHENLATRRLNEVEKGMVLSRLALWVPKSEILEHYMPLLDLPSHEPTFLFYIRLDKELDEKMKRYLVQGRLSLQVAKMLLEMSHEIRSFVLHLISTLRFNINQQKQLIDYLIDLSHIDNGALRDLLAGPSLNGIYSDNRLNNPQKARAVLRLLRTRRFPTLVRAERSFNKKVAGLDLPDGVRITAPPYFEASDYRLELLFKCGKELKEKIERLSRTWGLEDLGDPWMRGV